MGFCIDGDITLSAGSLLGTLDNPRTIEGIVTVTQQNANKAFEIRTYFQAQSDLKIFQLIFTKIPD